MLLDDDSPLLGTQDPLGEGDDDGVAALGLKALPAPAPPTGPEEEEEEEAAAPPPRLVEVSFEEGGSLGIEFQELEPPYVIQQVHDGGLANGRGLEPGDLLATAGGQAVDAMEWDDLVDLLTSRPVTLVFSRSPAGVKPSEGGASAAVGALFSSGFGRGVEEKDDAAVDRFVDAAPAAAAVPAAAAAPAAAGSADEVGQHKSDWNLAALDEYGDSSGSSTLTAPPPAAAICGGGGEAAAATRRRRGGGDRGGGWRRRQRLRAQHAAEVERLGADAQATLRQAELELETSRAAVERLGADLAARDAEVVRLTAALEEIKGLQVELEAVRQLREQEIKGLQVELEAVRQLREQESLAAKGQQDQLRFALDERDRRLQEQMDTVSQKDQEVKSLLRQLAALGDYRGDAQQRPEAVASAAQAEATTFEVMFALQGSLGLEFQQLSAPYVVNKVHDNGVASGLNIAPGDELIAVADSPVNEAPWADLVQRLGSRPVVARFRRAAAVGQVRPEAAQEGGRGFSLSSIGSSLLTGALVPAAREAQQPPQDSSRLQAEVERLGTLLKARDGDVAEVEGRLRQREEALRLLEAGDANAAGLAGLAQEREACFADAEQRAESLRAERATGDLPLKVSGSEGRYEVAYGAVLLRHQPTLCAPVLSSLRRGQQVTGTPHEVAGESWLRLSAKQSVPVGLEQTEKTLVTGEDDFWILIDASKSGMGVGELLRPVTETGGGKDEWVVMHSRVVVRKSPSTKAEILGFHKKGKTVSGVVTEADTLEWLKVKHEHGSLGIVDAYMLIDGATVGLGVLLEKATTSCAKAMQLKSPKHVLKLVKGVEGYCERAAAEAEGAEKRATHLEEDSAEVRTPGNDEASELRAALQRERLARQGAEQRAMHLEMQCIMHAVRA